jgi:AraC-like DNA-binding protein
MKIANTTNQKAHENRLIILDMDRSRSPLETINRLHIRLAGMYYSYVGPSWSSKGNQESDFLHHIEIPFGGHRQVVHGHRVLEVLPGHAYFYPGNTPAERRFLKPGATLWITFYCEWLPGVDVLMDWPDRRPSNLGPCDRTYWETWLKEAGQPSTNHLLSLQSKVSSWLASALPSLDAIIAEHLRTHAQFTQVFQLIEEKLGADLRITDLAKAHGCSAQSFTQAFSAATHNTPKEYLNRRLNQASIQLVIGSDLTMKEIAHRLRFSDEFYFSRFFKKLNHLPPTVYRARFRKT